jgi:hypothetical protein
MTSPGHSQVMSPSSGSLADIFRIWVGTVKGKTETMFGRGGERPYVPRVEFDNSTAPLPLKRLIILASFCQIGDAEHLMVVETSFATNGLGPSASNRVASKTWLPKQLAPPLLPRAGGLPPCRVEGPDCKLAPRQRTSFVAIHGQQLSSFLRKNRCELARPLRR